MNPEPSLSQLGAAARQIHEIQPAAHKVNTPQYVSEYALTPEERVRQLEAACAAGGYVSAADRALLRKEIEAERKKLANISAPGSGDPGTAVARDRGQ